MLVWRRDNSLEALGQWRTSSNDVALRTKRGIKNGRLGRPFFVLLVL